MVFFLLLGLANHTLNVLDLHNNSFIGSLPPAWADPWSAAYGLGNSLQQLYLHHNNLSGPMPASWQSGLMNVTRLTVYGNMALCGPHPPASGTGGGALCLDTSLTSIGKSSTVLVWLCAI